MFRLACKSVCLLRYIYNTGKLPFVDRIGECFFYLIWSLYCWWDWWSGLFVLQFVYNIESFVSPIYYRWLIFVDAFPNVQCSRKLRKDSASDCQKANGILVLARYLGVLNDVINIDSLNLQFLRTPILRVNQNMCANRIIQHLQILRCPMKFKKIRQSLKN